jgi:site-specific recombinase XerD
MINTDENIDDFLKKFSIEDLEKIKMLFSIIPGQEPKEIVTLRVFMDEYLNLIKSNRSRSYYKSVKIAFSYLIDFFSIQHSIHSLQQKDIENFLIHLQQKVNKGYVVYYRNLKAAFNKAKDWGYIKENYFTKVKLPKRQKLVPVFMDSKQLSEISKQIKNEIVKDVVVFAFYTGMRLNEIINLKWKNVNNSARIITVGDDKFMTKGRNQRFIPICDEVFEILVRKKSGTPSCVLPPAKAGQALKKGGEVFGFVFCKNNGKRFTGDYISKSFKLACKTAGVDNSIHFHSLRHSFASNLVQKGVPLYTIKELLGHSSISTTEIYSHLNMDSLRDAIKLLDETPSCVLPLTKGEKSGLKVFRINSGEVK